MASLNWIGKDAVVNHDKEVPFKLLQKVPSASVGKESKNLLVHGDNLEALKALMPFYKGKVKCIYIDPPYNTGNEGWVYNDKVNSPKIREWLGKVVGSEADDLTRHDKWLCMMYPRLRLLKDLLHESGAIYISIDDNEFTSLKNLCDEIFGRENYISTITVKVKDPAGVGQQSFIFDVSEYVLAYAKNLPKFKDSIQILPADLELLTEQYGSYNKILKDYGKPKFIKEITRAGVGKIKIYSCEGYKIQRTKDLSFKEYVANRKTIFADYNPSGGMILAIRDQIPRIGLSYLEYTPTKGRSAGQVIKNYFLNGRILSWLENVTVKEGNSLFKKTKMTNVWNIPNASLHLEGGVTFTNGKKPLSLVKKIIGLVDYDENIILDSFAGSGTTAHAVLELNKEDGKNRQFILIEMENNVARNITAQRIKKSIKKQGFDDGFEYCELAKPLFNEKGQINEQCSYNELATYIYFTETQTNAEKKNIKSPLIGESGGTAYYLLYEGKGKNDLTRAALTKLKIKQPAVVYADRCLVDEDELREKGVIFKQIPYEIKVY